MKRLATLLLILTAAFGAGCGDNDRSVNQSANAEEPEQAVQGGSQLAADDIASVTIARDAIDTACGLTQDQQGSDEPLDEAIKNLQAIYRADPEARISSGFMLTEPLNMEKLVKQMAKELRGCGKTAEATELESVVKS